MTVLGEDQEAAPGTGRRLLVAARWSFLSTAVMKFSGIAVSIVLARLLGPGTFGVVAVALVAQAALLSLNELGVSVALVRHQGDAREAAPTVMTLALVGSAACAALLVAAAPLVASALGVPAATGVVRLMALGVLVDGLASTPAALLQREFAQGRRAAADITNFALGSGVSVALAVAGSGAWSIPIGRVVGSTAAAVILLRLAPFPVRPGWSREQARSLLHVGVPLAGASLVVFGILNLDSTVVGSTVGAVGLGLYTLAFNLSSWPVTLLSGPVRSVSLPAFARLVDRPEDLARLVPRTFGDLMGLTVPVAATLGSAAVPLVAVVYGPQWSKAAPILAWLAALGGLRVAAELLYDLLVAVGESRLVLVVQVVWLAALAVALPVGATLRGVTGVAEAHCAVAVLLILPLYTICAARRLAMPATALLRRLGRPLLSGVVVVAVALVADAHLPHLAALAVIGAVGGLLTLRALVVLREGVRAYEM